MWRQDRVDPFPSDLQIWSKTLKLYRGTQTKSIVDIVDAAGCNMPPVGGSERMELGKVNRPQWLA